MTKEPREQITEHILDAAIEVIILYGLDNIQLTHIAKHAGMSARTLSRYYPEKEALLADAATRYLQKCYSTFIQNYEKLPKDGLSGREKLLLFLGSQKNYFRAQALDAMMMVDLRFYRVRHSSVGPSWAIPGGDGVKGIVVGCIEEGIKDGSVRPDLDPAMTSALISATYNGMMQRLTFIYRATVPADIKEPMYDIFNKYIEMADRYLRP